MFIFPRYEVIVGTKDHTVTCTVRTLKGGEGALEMTCRKFKIRPYEVESFSVSPITRL